MFLEFQFGIELFGGARFFGIDRLGPRIEPAKADVLAADRPPVEPERRFGQARQEGPVMADRDKCAAIPPQPVLEPVDRRKIEMVGRLVEQQDIGVHRQRAGDRSAATLPARGRGGIAREINADLAGDGFDIVDRWRVLPRQGKIAQCRMTLHRRFLFEQDDTRAGNDGPPPLVTVELAREQAQQCCFPRAIAPDQR